MSDLLELIKTRKSVRTFDENQISDQAKSSIENYMENVSNPFDIPVKFLLLDAEKHHLSSPVLAGEKLYIAGKVEKKSYADVAFGYSFEKVLLHAWSLGVGSVWIGGTMKREVFEAAANVADGEMMPCVSPLGYPAKKRSLKENMMRKGISADSRFENAKLFFENTWDNPLVICEEMADVFDMVKWAPSAVNKQPWRIILQDGIYHLYEKKDRGYDNPNTGDLQKIDVGIALCHLVMGLENIGKSVEVKIADPKIEIPEDVEYIVSVVEK
ncbi:MAG: nitroreductase family protein [Lachnospiraceae bacterium]|nr:nitroreductase family protein [Lachnospiraceae bacterium]